MHENVILNSNIIGSPWQTEKRSIIQDLIPAKSLLLSSSCSTIRKA